MGRKERDQALDMIKNLMDHDFAAKPLVDRLAQVDQGFGVTIGMLEAIAATTKDDKVKALAQLALLAWRHD